mmetsp:Transcript_12215/g.38693  ORF Transcript_12215/g.38693 Transcript_12215/m.38693 type:complete len:370 (-) Transcript_12215:94-1203(-)
MRSATLASSGTSTPCRATMSSRNSAGTVAASAAARKAAVPKVSARAVAPLVPCRAKKRRCASSELTWHGPCSASPPWSSYSAASWLIRDTSSCACVPTNRIGRPAGGPPVAAKTLSRTSTAHTAEVPTKDLSFFMQKRFCSSRKVRSLDLRPAKSAMLHPSASPSLMRDTTRQSFARLFARRSVRSSFTPVLRSSARACARRVYCCTSCIMDVSTLLAASTGPEANVITSPWISWNATGATPFAAARSIMTGVGSRPRYVWRVLRVDSGRGGTVSMAPTADTNSPQSSGSSARIVARVSGVLRTFSAKSASTPVMNCEYMECILGLYASLMRLGMRRDIGISSIILPASEPSISSIADVTSPSASARSA